MDFFDEFNRMSADEILSRIELDVAHDGRSYICPVCGHGRGGDGIRPRVNSKGQTRWKCFGCGANFSNFDLAGAVLGLNPEYDKAELTRRLKDMFGLEGDKQPARAGKKISGSVKTMANEQAKVEPRNFANLYEFCRGNRAKFLDEHGGSYRAITATTLEKYGVEVHNDFEFTVDGGKVKTPALIIPYVLGTKVDCGHFVARSISDTVKAFSQHGQDAPLYEPLPIAADNTANFIVESEIDALSIAQVFGGYTAFGCVATGGAGKWRKVLNELTKRFGEDERKPKIVVMFDNDDAGILNSQAMTSALRSAGFPTEIFFFAGGFKALKEGTVVTNSAGEVVEKVTKVDANVLLQAGKLKDHLIEALEDTGDKLDEQAATMRAMFEQAQLTPIRRSGINMSSVAEYIRTGFFADIERTSRYSSRSTGFENLDGVQIFLPGLYVIGAKPGAGKTTFVWQMLNQLADNGEFCVYASYEMSRFELVAKTIARELYRSYPDLSRRLKLTSTNLRRGAGKGLRELKEIADKFSFSKVNLHVAELTNTDISELCKHIRELQVQKPCTLAIDYLQIVPRPNSKMTTKEKIDDTMLQLKNFQRDTGATVVAVSAFNRANGNNAEFSSFRESSAIEYSADCVWALQRRDDDEDDVSHADPRPMELRCLKNRFGAPYTVEFDYYAAHDYFEPSEERKRSSYGH